MIAPAAIPPFAVDAAFDLLAFVDGLPAHAVGELVAPGGAVFVEDGRVCWAAARGLSRRLTELLARGASIDALTMERHFRTCRDERRPLGEHLVTNGLISAPDLRAALFQHTAESLVHLCKQDGGTTVRWAPRAHHGYSPRFTFGTAELFRRAASLEMAAAARAAEHDMNEWLRDGDWAVAFTAQVEPFACFGELPVTRAVDLEYLGKWARRTIVRSRLVAEEEPIIAIARPPRTLLVAEEADSFIVAETGPHGPARLMNRRAEARRPHPHARSLGG